MELPSSLGPEYISTEFNITEDKRVIIPIHEIFDGSTWYLKEINREKLINAAQELLNIYSNSRYFSLGQSPSWLVKTAELLANTQDSIEDKYFGYIPFSGNLYTAILKNNNILEYIRSDNDAPEDKYRSYLETINMDIDSIINAFEKNNQQTIILERMCSGSGLISFISILYKWASEIESSTGTKATQLLQQSLKIVILYDENESPRSSLKLSENNIDIDLNPLCSHTKSLFKDLDHGLDYGAKSDRLVPYYPPENWNNLPTPFIENKILISGIIENMNTTITECNLIGISELFA